MQRGHYHMMTHLHLGLQVPHLSDNVLILGNFSIQ